MVGIVINPTCQPCNYVAIVNTEHSENLYEIGIIFESRALKYKLPEVSDTLDIMIKNSNRKIIICNSEYPVFISKVDEVFHYAKIRRIKYESLPDFYYLNVPGHCVDMARKKVLY